MPCMTEFSCETNTTTGESAESSGPINQALKGSALWVA